MGILTSDERGFARAVSQLAYANPFLPERIEWEREALGADFAAGGTLWDSTGEPELPPNVKTLSERADALVRRVDHQLASGARLELDEASSYEDLVVYLLFTRYEEDFYGLIRDTRAGTGPVVRADRKLSGDRAAPGPRPPHRPREDRRGAAGRSPGRLTSSRETVA